MIKTFLLLLMPLFLFAIEAKVSMKIKNNQTYFVSQKIVLLVKVSSTAFSINDVDIEYQDNNDFVIIPPMSASYNYSEDEFQGVVYEYEIYPLKGGDIELKPFTISFSSSLGYAQKKSYFKEKTESISLHVDTVDGYEFLLASSEVTLHVEYENSTNILDIGDAITRKIAITAKNIPDLLIPKIDTNSIDGIKLYKDEPILKQTKTKDGYISSRVEKETFILSKDGNFSIDGFTLHWYNTKSKKVMSETIKAFSFEVKKPIIIKESEPLDIKSVLQYLLFSLVLVFIFYKLYKEFKNRQAIQKELYMKTSLGTLQMLIESCDTKDIKLVYNNFYIWGKSLNIKPLNLDEIAKYFPELKEDLKLLNISFKDNNFDFSHCKKLLIEIRNEQLQKTNKLSLLKDINPKQVYR